MLDQIAGWASQHQILVLVASLPLEFAIEVLDVILGRMPKAVWIETIGTTALKIFQQELQRLLSAGCFSHFRLRPGTTLNPGFTHQFIGRK